MNYLWVHCVVLGILGASEELLGPSQTLPDLSLAIRTDPIRTINPDQNTKRGNQTKKTDESGSITVEG